MHWKVCWILSWMSLRTHSVRNVLTLSGYDALYCKCVILYYALYRKRREKRAALFGLGDNRVAERRFRNGLQWWSYQMSVVLMEPLSQIWSTRVNHSLPKIAILSFMRVYSGRPRRQDATLARVLQDSNVPGSIKVVLNSATLSDWIHRSCS